MTAITTLEYGIWNKINLCFWVMAIQFGSGINSLIPFNVRTVCFVYFLPCFIITLMFLVGFKLTNVSPCSVYMCVFLLAFMS